MISSSLQRSRLKMPLRSRMQAVVSLVVIMLVTGCGGGGETSNSTKASEATPTTSSSVVPTPSNQQTSATAQSNPSAESTLKALVSGFPTTLIQLMPGAQIQTSSLQTSSPRSVASLTASITATPAQVLAFYTTSLTSQGFVAQAGDSVDGFPLKTFIRAEGQEIVTVAVVSTADVSTFTIGANVLPASLK